MSAQPKPLMALVREWEATHEPGQPIGSKAAFRYDIEKECAKQLRAALKAWAEQLDAGADPHDEDGFSLISRTFVRERVLGVEEK